VRPHPVRTLAATAVIMLVAASCTGASQSNSASPVVTPVVPVSQGRISNLWLTPYPEGPQALFCPHPEARIGDYDCLRLPIAKVTAALGSPVLWPASTRSHDCDMGYTMRVTFTNAKPVVYGPCEHPASIEALRVSLFQKPT